MYMTDFIYRFVFIFLFSFYFKKNVMGGGAVI